MHDYFGHGFQTFSGIKHLNAKSDGRSWDKILSNGGLICVSLGVLDKKTFENHYSRGSNTLNILIRLYVSLLLSRE